MVVSNLAVLQSPTMDHLRSNWQRHHIQRIGVIAWDCESIVSPWLDGDGNFYIIAQVHGAELWRYYLNKANLMQPIL